MKTACEKWDPATGRAAGVWLPSSFSVAPGLPDDMTWQGQCIKPPLAQVKCGPNDIAVPIPGGLLCLAKPPQCPLLRRARWDGTKWVCQRTSFPQFVPVGPGEDASLPTTSTSSGGGGGGGGGAGLAIVALVVVGAIAAVAMGGGAK